MMFSDTVVRLRAEFSIGKVIRVVFIFVVLWERIKKFVVLMSQLGSD